MPLSISIALTALVLPLQDSRPAPSSGGGAKPPVTAPKGPVAPGAPRPGTPPAPVPGGAGAPAPSWPHAPTGFTGPDTEPWTLWWRHHEERFLELHRHVEAGGAGVTTQVRDGETVVRADALPTREELSQRVAPALRQILEASRDYEAVAAAVRALAELRVDPEGSARLLALQLRHANPAVAESAILGLGILGDAGGVEPLRALFEDSPAGRTLRGGQPLSCSYRALAAHALGLAGSRGLDDAVAKHVRDSLLVSLTRDQGKCLDVQTAAIVALGQLPDADGRIATALERYLRDNGKRREMVAAHVPTSVGKILRDAPAKTRLAAAKEIARELGARTYGSARWIRPGWATSLGLLVRLPDKGSQGLARSLDEAIETLTGKNVEAASLAAIALGEIAGTGAPGNEAERALVARAVAKGGRNTLRSFSALALGVSGFEQRRRGLAPDATISAALLERLTALEDPERRAAFALALGLRGHAPAAAEILACLEEVRSEDLRGYFATALGLLGARDAAPRIRALLQESQRFPEVIRQASYALALLGDRSVQDLLLARLAEPGGAVESIAVPHLQALGRVGDRRALDPLLAMARDETGGLEPTVRAEALRALGRIGDADVLPWWTRLEMSFNYVAFDGRLPR